MGEDSGEKTEEATPHKLREARKKGQIAKGKDITGAALLFASFYTLQATGGFVWDNMVKISKHTYDQIPYEFSIPIVGKILSDAMLTMLIAVGPIFGVTMLVAIFIESLQTGFLLTLEPLMPKLEKLNPIEGFKKFFSMKQYVELLKSILKMVVVIWLLYGALKEKFYLVLESQSMSLTQIISTVADIVMTVVTRLGIFYVIMAALDFFYQKYEHNKEMKMSMKEIKDEYKRLEGDPMIKQRQRDAARQMAQGRQMGAVPGADVVVTNPIHIAVALEYKANMMKAPIVVAMGKRMVAREIRRIAEEHYIPIIENPPLAQALFKTATAGAEVPAEHYKAVAEILAFVYNLKRKRKRRNSNL